MAEMIAHKYGCDGSSDCRCAEIRLPMPDPPPEMLEKAQEWLADLGGVHPSVRPSGPVMVDAESLAALLAQERAASLKDHREALSKAHEKIRADYDKALEERLDASGLVTLHMARKWVRQERERWEQAVRKVRQRAVDRQHIDPEYRLVTVACDELLRELGIEPKERG